MTILRRYSIHWEEINQYIFEECLDNSTQIMVTNFDSYCTNGLNVQFYDPFIQYLQNHMMQHLLNMETMKVNRHVIAYGLLMYMMQRNINNHNGDDFYKNNENEPNTGSGINFNFLDLDYSKVINFNYDNHELLMRILHRDLYYEYFRCLDSMDFRYYLSMRENDYYENLYPLNTMINTDEEIHYNPDYEYRKINHHLCIPISTMFNGGMMVTLQMTINMNCYDKNNHLMEHIA